MLILKNIIGSLKELLIEPIRLARLHKKYPTCHFYSGAVVDDESVLGRYNVVFACASINHSTIGDHTFIQKNSTVNYAIIGKFCSIASGVTIGLGQHPTSYVSSHPAFYSSVQPVAKTFCNKDSFSPFRQTDIGHDVWIGQNAMVTDGVKIGTGAIVAAGAVVTKNVPEYAMVGGVPANIIRYRFDENIRRELLETKWWEWPEEQLGHYAALFTFPEKFLKLYKSGPTLTK